MLRVQGVFVWGVRIVLTGGFVVVLRCGVWYGLVRRRGVSESVCSFAGGCWCR